MDPHGRLGRGLTSKQHHHQAPLCFVVYDTRMCLRKGQLNHVFAQGSVESTHKVPTSHYRTKHCHAAVAPLGGLTHR